MERSYSKRLLNLPPDTPIVGNLRGGGAGNNAPLETSGKRLESQEPPKLVTERLLSEAQLSSDSVSKGCSSTWGIGFEVLFVSEMVAK